MHTHSVTARRRGVNDTSPTNPAITVSADRTADSATVTPVDVRIAVTHAARELTVEIPDDERDDVNARIEAALTGSLDVLWLVDKRGRRVGVPSANIAYIEVGTPDGDRRIGFGG